jgi:hypothetical protein
MPWLPSRTEPKIDPPGSLIREIRQIDSLNSASEPLAMLRLRLLRSRACAHATSDYQAIEAHGTLAGGGGSSRMFPSLKRPDTGWPGWPAAPRTVLPSGLAQASPMPADVATGHGPQTGPWDSWSCRQNPASKGCCDVASPVAGGMGQPAWCPAGTRARWAGSTRPRR